MSEEDSSVHADDIEENNDTVRMQFDWSSKNPSTAVVETVAAAANSELNEIEPLYTVYRPGSVGRAGLSEGDESMPRRWTPFRSRTTSTT